MHKEKAQNCENGDRGHAEGSAQNADEWATDELRDCDSETGGDVVKNTKFYQGRNLASPCARAGGKQPRLLSYSGDNR